MADNVLKAVITADGQQFNKTLAQLQAQLKRFEQAATITKSPESFARLNRAIDATKQKISGLQNIPAPLNKIQQGADNATGSLINLGRVVQDAPFGFIGIANNLNPLQEGFSRLVKQTGSFGGALKSLGSSLLGAGGISLGISLVSSALILFGDELFGAGKKAKALDESLKSLAESTAKDIVQLTTLVGVVKNSNTSNEDREKAIKAINQQYDTYLKNLGLEEVNLQNINSAYEQIVNNLLRQAVVKGLQNQIAKSVEETAKQVLKLEIEQENQRIASEKATKQLTEQEKQARDLAIAEQLRTGVVKDGIIAQTLHDAQLRESIDASLTYEARLAAIKRKLQEQIQPLLNVTDKFADLGIKLDEAGNKGDKSMSDLISRAKELADFLSKTTIRDFKFEVSPLETKEQTAAKARKFIEDALGFLQGTGSPIELRQIFNIKPEISDEFVRGVADETLKKLGLLRLPNGTITLDLSRVRVEVSEPPLVAALNKAFENIDKSLKQKPIVRLTAQAQIELDAATIDAKNIQDAAKQVEAVINSALGGAINAVSEGIGDLLSGQDPGRAITSFFSGLLNDLGKSLIQYGIVKTGIDKILTGGFKIPGAIAIALGAAAIAASQLIKNLKGSYQQREFGGPVIAGQPYIVGERRPELFIPNTGGRIVPNLSSLGGGVAANGGINVNVTGALVVRGNDLVASLASTNRYQKRNS